MERILQFKWCFISSNLAQGQYVLALSSEMHQFIKALAHAMIIVIELFNVKLMDLSRKPASSLAMNALIFWCVVDAPGMTVCLEPTVDVLTSISFHYSTVLRKRPSTSNRLAKVYRVKAGCLWAE